MTTSNPFGTGMYGMPGPPQPPKRRSAAFAPLIAVGTVVAVISLIGIVVVGVRLATRGDDSPGGPDAGSSHGATATARPSRTASPSPTSVLYSSLPNPCSLGGTLPSKAASIKGDGDHLDTGSELDRSCQWEKYASDHAVDLDIELTLPSDAGSAKSTYSDDKSYDESDTEFKKNVAAVSGLGDEAYSAQASDDITYGKTEASAKDYIVAGAKVEVRAGNAIIEVDWEAATYSDSSGSVLRGTYLDYGQAKSQAIKMVKHLMAGLS